MTPAGLAGVTLARILRPRGRRGEVAAKILTDFPERLKSLREAFLWDGKSEPRRAGIRACWLHKNQAIFHFEGCDSIAEAERLRGLDVQVPLAERMPLPAGRHYTSDLVGCEVWERDPPPPGQERGRDGALRRLGVVREVQCLSEETTGTPQRGVGAWLLVVETPRGEMLIPLAEEICTRIETAARRIEVALPEGLRELNRE